MTSGAKSSLVVLIYWFYGNYFLISSVLILSSPVPLLEALPAVGEPLGSQAPPDRRRYEDGSQADQAGDQLLLAVLGAQFLRFAHQFLVLFLRFRTSAHSWPSVKTPGRIPGDDDASFKAR